jgi:enoyl-CoA hydratase/carnithine racemase
LGLALTADFRIAGGESRFAANFAAIGLHPGFGITLTLPRVVGRQAAWDLMLTGRRIGGEEAARLGLCDRLVSSGQERLAAIDYAKMLAASAPLAVREIRHTLRGPLVKDFARATRVEFAAQSKLFDTDDFAEGVLASSQRREANFTGH